MPCAHKMPAAQIGNRNPRADRSLPGQARDGHEAAHALRDLIEARPLAIGPVLAESGDAGVNQAAVDRAHGGVVDTQTNLDFRPVVFDQNVGGLRHAFQNGDSLGRSSN